MSDAARTALAASRYRQLQELQDAIAARSNPKKVARRMSSLFTSPFSRNSKVLKERKRQDKPLPSHTVTDSVPLKPTESPLGTPRRVSYFERDHAGRNFKRYSLTPRRAHPEGENIPVRDTVAGSPYTTPRKLLFDRDDPKVTPYRRLSLTPRRMIASRKEPVFGERESRARISEMEDAARSQAGNSSTESRRSSRGGSRRGRISRREMKAIENNDVDMGSEVVLTPVRASKQQQQKLGTKTVLTPVRRSRRGSTRRQADKKQTFSERLEATAYAFSPNKNIHQRAPEQKNTSEGDT